MNMSNIAAGRMPSGAKSIRNWKIHADHQIAQNTGRSKWYKSHRTRIPRVGRDYAFEK